MKSPQISRRNFLVKSTTLATGANLLLSNTACNNSSDPSNPNNIITLPKFETQSWQNLSKVTDNSLENGFSFNLGNYQEFDRIVNTQDRDYALGAIGEKIKKKGKTFTIVNLNRNQEGISIDLLETDRREQLIPGIPLNLDINGKDYSITLRGLGSPQGPLSIPNFIFEINGTEIIINDSNNYVDGLNIIPDARFFYENKGSGRHGSFPFFFSKSRFTSRTDQGEDTQFSGLEKTLFLNSLHPPQQQTQKNNYNKESQPNSFFRLDAIPGDHNTQQPIQIRRIEKLISHTSSITIPSRFATSYDLDVKKRDNNSSQINISEEIFDQTLEGSFQFDFSDNPIETKTGGFENQVPGLGTTFPPEMFSYRILDSKKEFLIRYIAVNTSLTKTSKEGIFLPRNSIFTEILEDPISLTLKLGAQTVINTLKGNYTLTLISASSSPKASSGTSALKTAKLMFKVEKKGTVDTILYQNAFNGIRIGPFNLDVDIAQYHRGAVQGLQEHKFFLSESKFSSATDFYDDNQFSGLKKVTKLISNNPRPYQILTHTFANRYNGQIQSNSYFRVLAEFGVKEFQRLPNSKTQFKIKNNPRIRDNSQFKEGYILRIDRLEKVKI